MSPHTKRSAILPNASSFFPPLPALSPFPHPPLFSLPLPHRRPPPPTLQRPRRRIPLSFSPSPHFPPPRPFSPTLRYPPPRPCGRGGRGKSQTRRAAFGGVAAPRTALEGRGGSLGTAGFLWARGLAQAAAGRTRRQKGTKKPLLSRIRAKILRKILQFAPPCVILCMPRNSIDNVTRYKRAFLYLFFFCDFIYAKE